MRGKQVKKQKNISSFEKQSSLEREDIRRLRVIQRNLVYVSGFPESLLKESVLKSFSFFGQYGEIKSLVVCEQKTIKNECSEPYIYITYREERDACLAILSANNYTINQKKIQVSFGLSRLCKKIYQGQTC